MFFFFTFVLIKESNMKLNIKNIGIIDKADINLNGLTVIAGVNDSGKSTIGKTIYLGIKALANAKLKVGRDKSSRILGIIKSMYSYLGDSRFEIDLLSDTPESMRDKITNTISDVSSLEQYFNQIIEAMDKAKFSPRILGAVTEKMVELLELKKYKGIYSDLKTEVDELIRSEFVGSFSKEGVDNSAILLTDDDNKSFSIKIKENKVEDIIAPPDDNTFFEDVTYIESPLYLHMLQSILTQSMSNTCLPHHIVDMATKLYSVGANGNKYSNSAQILEKISNIISGEFTFDSQSNTLNFRRNEIEIPVINVSSGMKSFGVIQMLLQGRIINYDRMLIWDEPENHVHPEWQLNFAEVLVQLAKSGITILITTHSPYFLQAVRYYSAKYDNEKYVEYYLAKKDVANKQNILDNVNNNISEVFYLLSAPLDNIMNVDAVRGKY